MLDITKVRMSSIQNHLGMLEGFLKRNRAWAVEKNKPEVYKTHKEIIDLLEQIRNKYYLLLDLYGNGRNTPPSNQ
jgi:hypothetical protein